MNPILPDRKSLLDWAIALLKDNGILAGKIECKCSISKESVENILNEVLRFLALVAHYNETLTPSRKVDDAWHELILFTRVYAEFCQSRFGRFIHHFPGGGKTKNELLYRQTLELYRRHFGEPDSRFWGNPDKVEDESDCGPCEAKPN